MKDRSIFHFKYLHFSFSLNDSNSGPSTECAKAKYIAENKAWSKLWTATMFGLDLEATKGVQYNKLRDRFKKYITDSNVSIQLSHKTQWHINEQIYKKINYLWV